MSIHNLCIEQKYEKYQTFLSENFQFLEVKLSIDLNRRVFVMNTNTAWAQLGINNHLAFIFLILDFDFLT